MVEIGYQTRRQMLRPQCCNERTGTCTSIEQLPPHIIDEILVNPLAEEWLHPSVKNLSSPVTLIKLAHFATFPQNPSNVIFSTPGWTRALNIAEGVMPYSDIVGALISIKGTLPTGRLYGVGQKPQKNHPTGLFGVKDAQVEVDIANALLTAGVRSALPLGYIVLNRERLTRWLGESNLFEPIYLNSLFQSIDTVCDVNGDKLAMLIRIHPCQERISPQMYPRDNDIEKEIKAMAALRRAHIAQSAKVLLAELQLFPNVFADCQYSIQEMSSTLERIAQRQQISLDDLKIYIHSMFDLIRRNIIAFEKIPSDIRSKYSSLITVLGAEKDLDLTFTHCDYEGADVENNNPFQKTFATYEFDNFLTYFSHVFFLNWKKNIIAPTSQVINRTMLHEFMKLRKAHLHFFTDG